jgi:hypothetical protein
VVLVGGVEENDYSMDISCRRKGSSEIWNTFIGEKGRWTCTLFLMIVGRKGSGLVIDVIAFQIN